MTAIFITILNMSITASIVAVAVMLARFPLKNAPKVFSYALWSVVLFRLIFPYSIQSIFSLMPANATIPHEIIFTQNQVAQPAVQTNITAAPLIMQASEASIPPPALEIAGYIWLIGFIILLAYAIIGYVGLKRRIRFATRLHGNIFETDRIKTPFMLGFIRPKIYFPTSLDHSQHDYILKHEQIHIKRRDYLIKPFAYIVFALHWFNPLMWAAYFLMSRDMEMSCDEAVLGRMAGDIRRDYSTSLLRLSTKRVSLLCPIAFSLDGGSVKQRITNVLKFKKPANWVTALSVAVVGVFLVGFSSDRILAIDAPNIGSSSAASFNINFASWHTDARGARLSSPEEAQEIGEYILGRYFSAFRQDWGGWGDAPFYLAAYFGEFTADGNSSWLSGRVSDNLGDNRFFIPAFAFLVDAETSRLKSAGYSPPITDYIETNIAPFPISMAEAFAIHGNRWFARDNMPLQIHGEYMDMLIAFSQEHIAEAGLGGSGIISTGSSVEVSFANNFANVNVYMSLSCGADAMLSFWVFDTHFTLIGFTIDFL